MANVIVVSQKLNKAGRVSNFTGNTLGELLQTSTDNGINIADLYSEGEVEVVANPGNLSLRGLDSVLPEGDVKVFFTIKKNKAGMEDFEDKVSDIHYDLEHEVDEFLESQLQEIVDAGKAAMRAKIAELKGNPVYAQQVETDPELSDALAELRNI
jgi:hypothetical protein